ncbi:MOSC domain-containing protein [Oleomonas cavernae]|uniref:MOSC domain-containing protein n=1 Tax=Oleomonas cavernae TaxID=2320859 RepID=A0A418WA70_9PROT|nr:MOSC N-terminal beta barrel domain-containing protein [Oleomonas cavernae]RJF86910.1 MOSC domain-containing protein [Oleomonas cavernae]
MSFTVKEIWRYPVKSMQGEKLDACAVSPLGIPYDRGWAVRDEKTQTIRGAKHLPKLMLCAARYVNDAMAGAVPHVEITLPGGERIRSDAPGIHAAVSEAVGREVTLWPLVAAENKDHYRIHEQPSGDPIDEWRRIFALGPEDPMPDLGGFSAELLQELIEYASPLGTYFDAFPINLLTESSLRHLQNLAPEAVLDARRFRPNFLLADDTAAGVVEEAWVGRQLRIGTASLDISARAPRCVMTSHAQPGLDRDPTVIRTIVRELESCLSVYATVAAPGAVTIGDAIVVA